MLPLVPIPVSVLITSSQANPVTVGSTLVINCTVELSPVIMDSDLSLLTVDVQLSRDGIALIPTNSTVALPTFTYIKELESFERNDSGNYTCAAVIRPKLTLTYLTESDVLSNTTRITSGDPLLHHCNYNIIIATMNLFVYIKSFTHSLYIAIAI